MDRPVRAATIASLSTVNLFGRAFDDGRYYALLDVVVRPAYQIPGYGSRASDRAFPEEPIGRLPIFHFDRRGEQDEAGTTVGVGLCVLGHNGRWMVRFDISKHSTTN